MNHKTGSGRGICDFLLLYPSLVYGFGGGLALVVDFVSTNSLTAVGGLGAGLAIYLMGRKIRAAGIIRYEFLAREYAYFTASFSAVMFSIEFLRVAGWPVDIGKGAAIDFVMHLFRYLFDGVSMYCSALIKLILPFVEWGEGLDDFIEGVLFGSPIIFYLKTSLLGSKYVDGGLERDLRW